jgi:hypothetical protein
MMALFDRFVKLGAPDFRDRLYEQGQRWNQADKAVPPFLHKQIKKQ